MRLRYLLVGGLCAAVHNGVMIGGAALNLHYAAATALSFVTVVPLGFLLQARFTFSVQPSPAAFLRYAAGLGLNYPIWLTLMFGLNGMLELPMIVASPIGTVLMVIWNYAVSCWALLRPRAGPRTVTGP